MRILNWRKFNENEYTKLATNFMGGMHKDLAFNGPQDNFQIKYCTIVFPDGSTINYDCQEFHGRDIGTFKLSVITQNGPNFTQEARIAQLYLNLYGNEIQFDDFNSYQMIRYYMNKEDLFDTTFDGYIYGSTNPKGESKLGATDIQIKITGINVSDNKPQYISKYGIFEVYKEASTIFTLTQAYKIIENKQDWRNYFTDHKDETLQNFIDPLDKISIETNDHVIPSQVNYNGINICGYLYLYGIIHGFTEKHKDIKLIINNFNNSIEPEKIIGVLYEMI